MTWTSWSDVVRDSMLKARKLGQEYFDRLKYEHQEIIKQGANEYWMELINSGEKFNHNDNGLVLPFIYGITNIDPIRGQTRLFVNGDEIKMNGIEIVLENGAVLNVSEHTIIKTTRGNIKAKDLLEDDEIV